VTKPITATLIMQLVEEGLIDLDAPVSQYAVDAGLVFKSQILTN